MEFYKYQATGNDFVMVDNRSGSFNEEAKNVALMCHRRFGVGADGLILVENVEGYDFRMKYFNADGHEGSMCGNGARSVVRFAADLGIIRDKAFFLAVDGEHYGSIAGDIVSIRMKDVEGVTQEKEGYFLDTGSPHLVIFMDEIDNLDVFQTGRDIRYSDFWQKRGGVNVNFVKVSDSKTLKVRTYERGVEDETYSCGTGATASAIVAHLYKKTLPDVQIETKGGVLNVSLNEAKEKINDIILSGPAQKVFSGFF